MNIPEEAVQAAAETFAYATGNDWRQVSAPDQEIYLQEARAALEAALPHIEAALRKQIANDPGYYAITYISGSTWNNALYQVIEQEREEQADERLHADD